jgi:hypothetical protein
LPHEEQPAALRATHLLERALDRAAAERADKLVNRCPHQEDGASHEQQRKCGNAHSTHIMPQNTLTV